MAFIGGGHISVDVFYSPSRLRSLEKKRHLTRFGCNTYKKTIIHTMTMFCNIIFKKDLRDLRAIVKIYEWNLTLISVQK